MLSLSQEMEMDEMELYSNFESSVCVHVSRDQINNHFKVHLQCAESRLSPQLRLCISHPFRSDFASVTFSIRLCAGRSDIHTGFSLSIPSIATYVSKQSSLTQNPNKIQTPCSCGVWNQSQTCPLSAAPAVLTGKRVEFSLISQDKYMCLYLQIQAFRCAKDRQNR